MTRICIYCGLTALVFALGACSNSSSTSSAVPKISADLTAAVDNYARPPADRTRDADRKPAQVLAFAGIKPGDKVVDLIPEQGYYTRILSKLVGPDGHVYSYVPIPGYPIIREELEKAGKPVPIDPALAIQDIHSEYPNVTAVWEQLYAFGGSFGLPEQVDAVLVADGYHKLHDPGFATPGGDDAKPLDVVGTDKAIFRALKPGGVFVIVDNQAASGAGFSQTEALGRAEADAVKKEVVSAGFVLDGESNVLANASDNHSADADALAKRDKADQYVLRFKKPDDASPATQRPADANAGMESYFGNTRHSGINRDVQRWVHYHPDGTFEEYGNTAAYVQLGTWFWDVDGKNCMLKEFPLNERGSVICHDYSQALNQPVGVPIGEGQSAWQIDKGYTFPAPPPRDAN